MGKKPEDNRDIFETALDDLQFYLPAAGVAAGAIAGRKLSKAAHKIRAEQGARDAEVIKGIPAEKYRYGKLQKQDELDGALYNANAPYRPSGMRSGAILGGIAGYGASDTLAGERKRRAKK